MVSNSFRAVVSAEVLALLQYVIEFVQGTCAASFVKLNICITKSVLGKRILCPVFTKYATFVLRICFKFCIKDSVKDLGVPVDS